MSSNSNFYLTNWLLDFQYPFNNSINIVNQRELMGYAHNDPEPQATTWTGCTNKPSWKKLEVICV